MAASARPVLADDDFLIRIRKLKLSFTKDVIPTHLIDYLTCLDELDEEIVKARERNYGTISAAGELFDRLIRRDGWFKDLVDALKRPEVGLKHLADEFEKEICTVPVVWDIGSFKDQNGVACFNGHCCTSPQTDRTNSSDTAVKVPLPDPSRDNAVETKIKEFFCSRDRNTSETLAEKRERIRLELFEKIIDSIRTAADIPIAIDQMKKVNLEIRSIDYGSIVFAICVRSLDALDSLEHMWRYGGLKKMLDKEVFNSEMEENLFRTSVDLGHPVTDIRSHLHVCDTDLLRCRTWISSLETDIQPLNFADSSLRKRSGEAVRGSNYVRDRLPDEILSLLDDPFLSNRICTFYESQPIRQKLANTGEYKDISVFDLFVNWFDEEVKSYLKSLESSIMDDLIVFVSHMIEQVKAGKSCTTTLELPQSFTNMSLPYVHSGTSASAKCFDKIFSTNEIKSEVDADNVIKSLQTLSVIHEYRGHLDFKSMVLRDILATKIVVMGAEMDENKRDAIYNHFVNLQTLLGMYQGYWKQRVDSLKWNTFHARRFKTDVLRKVTEDSCEVELTRDAKIFITEDLLLKRKVTVNVSEDLMFLLNNTDAVTVSETRKQITVDVSKLMENGRLPLSSVLSLINRTTVVRNPYSKTKKYSISEYIPSVEYKQDLKLDGTVLDHNDVTDLGLFLNVSPTTTILRLKNCNLNPASLNPVLKCGYLRNIHNLHLSNNPGLKEVTLPLGLVYMSSVETLDIQNCELGDAGIAVLATEFTHLPKLKELNVACNNISHKGLLELSKGLCTGLTSLRLHRNKIGTDGCIILGSWLKELITLEILNISECSIGDKGASVVATALVSRSLRKLSMRANGFTSKGSEDFFKNFQRPNTLEHIDFGDNVIFEQSGRLTMIQPTKQIEVDPFVDFLQMKVPFSHLSLWKCGLGEHRIFQNMQRYDQAFTLITHLCLQDNQLMDDFIEDVAECIETHSEYLQHLNLRENKIGNDGAMRLSTTLKKCVYLEEVFLDRNMIGDSAAEELVSSCVEHQYFSLLDLSCNSFAASTKRLIGLYVEGINVGAIVTDTSTLDDEITTGDPNTLIVKKAKNMLRVIKTD